MFFDVPMPLSSFVILISFALRASTFGLSYLRPFPFAGGPFPNGFFSGVG
jgi:hypothetical protein